MNDRILRCLYAAIDEANEDRPDVPPVRKSLETPVQGAGTELDSLALINFLVAVEEGLEREFGGPVALTDERAIEREPSPFETVRTLGQYIEEMLAERQSPAS